MSTPVTALVVAEGHGEIQIWEIEQVGCHPQHLLERPNAAVTSGEEDQASNECTIYVKQALTCCR